MRTSSKLATLALAIAALVVAAAPRANADTCATGGPSNSVSVCYTLTGGVLTIDSATVLGSQGKIDVVGVQGASIADTGGTLAATLFTSTQPGCDGFGSCSNVKNSGGNGESFPLVSFTITGTPTEIIIHEGGFSTTSCSLWFEFAPGATTGSTNSDFGSTCVAPPPVPEPGTLGLLGTGLIGIAGLVRRRFRS